MTQDTPESVADLISRLGYHSESQHDGKMRLTNPDGPEAAAAIARLFERACGAEIREDVYLRSIAENRALASSPAVGEVIPSDNETVRYVSLFGGFCRDCADEDGVCPHKGLPCQSEPNDRAIRHVISALNYGLRHGYLARLPAAPDGETA